MRPYVLAILLISGCQSPAMAQIQPNLAVQAIIGEAEAEGAPGMLAVACTLRNRGNLKGVYGLQSFRVTHHLYSQHTLAYARLAWKYSEQADLCQAMVHGAKGWGSDSDLIKFKKHAWWKRCVITDHVGGHWFYKEVR